MRSTINDAANRVQTSSVGRATIREVDDNHLCQECKHGDTGFSRTHSDFEVWQPLGVTSVPMKQKEEKQAQQSQQGQQGAQWNKNQPKGEAAEMMMLYVGGNAAHPVGLPQDRRCRPYDMEPGEGGLYDSQDGKQMTYFRNRGDGSDGVYIVGCDKEQEEQQSGGQGGGNPGGGGGGGEARALYLRYASKKKQSRKPQKDQQGQGGQQGQQRQRYKHEGDGIETQMKLDGKKITYNDGDKEVGHYDRGKKDWLHHDGQGATHSMRADKSHSHVKHEGAHIWVDGACWSSMPIQIKGDDCS